MIPGSKRGQRMKRIITALIGLVLAVGLVVTIDLQEKNESAGDKRNGIP